MFGYTLIKKSEFDRINKLLEERNDKVEEYAAELIEHRTKLLRCTTELEKYSSDCYAGVWCGSCKYCGFSEFTMPFRETYTYPTNKGTYYCKKHIKKICKEYEE